MNIASRILIVGGISVLSAGFLLGVPMAMARKKAPRAPRYLVAAHLAAIIQGGLLLALTVAMEFAVLAAPLQILAAISLVGGVVLFDAGLALNWLQGVEDAFGEGSVGNAVSTMGTPFVLGGTGIVLYGVLAAL